MDLNHIRSLAGLPAKSLPVAAPVIVEKTMPEAKVVRTEQLNEGQKAECDRIFSEVMSALGKSAPMLSAVAKKAIKDAIGDAYEAGRDDRCDVRSNG